MKLLVVVVSFRVVHLTIECLRSLAEEVKRVPGMQVAVCENGTGDDSAQRIQKEISDNGWETWCTLTAVYPNRGFTGGNNAILKPAMQSADPPQYVLLLNADTIVKPNTIKTLVDFMDEHPEVGIAGSRVESPDGTPQGSPFRFMTPISEFERNLNFGPMRQLLKRWVISPEWPNQACEVDWVSGVCMIIRREVMRDIGELDEGYYTYYDDIDFCFNARKAGWVTWYVPASCITHFGGQTTGVNYRNRKRLPPYLFEARRRYFLKNHGPFYAALADAAQIIGLSLWRLRVFLTRKPDFRPVHLLRDCIRHSVFLTGFELKEVQNPAMQSRR